MMLRVGPFFFALALFGAGFSGAAQQLTPRRVVAHLPNRIDSLHSARDVERWVTQNMPRRNYFYPPFQVDTVLTMYGLDFQQQCARLGVQDWLKVDLDGNGYTDLVAYRHRGRQRWLYTEPWLFMSYGNQVYRPELLQGRGAGPSPVVALRYLEGTPALVFYHHVTPRQDRANLPQHVPRLDTLMYQQGGLIDYHRHRRPQPIRKIELAGLADQQPQNEFVLLPDRTVTYRNVSNTGIWGPPPNPRPLGTFQTKLDTSTFNQIWRVAQQLPLQSGLEKYNVGWTDAGTIHLRVSFGPQSVYQVEDYGERASFTHSYLYTLIYRLRDTQSWHPIATSDDSPTR